MENSFPGLRGQPYQITSPPNDQYNCVAWAAGDTSNWWWPDEDNSDFWPSGVAREETLEAFRDAFSTLGFVICESAELEDGFEKIAIFSLDGVPKHAARQLPHGRWTSKLGMGEDIEHELVQLSGTAYGCVAMLMRRLVPASA